MQTVGQSDLEQALKDLARERKDVSPLEIERANRGLLDPTLIAGDNS